MSHVLIVGASRGLGRALATNYLAAGHTVTATARTASALDDLREATPPGHGSLHTISGTLTDTEHHRSIADAGPYDVVIIAASSLGAQRDGTTLRPLAATTMNDVCDTFTTNVAGPVALLATLMPKLRDHGATVLLVSSDAAVKHYETWGVYGASKAALDHVAATLAAEEPTVRTLAIDPGEMRTTMLAEAMPDDDLTWAADPADVATTLIATLNNTTIPSGRYTAKSLTTAKGATA